MFTIGNSNSVDLMNGSFSNVNVLSGPKILYLMSTYKSYTFTKHNLWKERFLLRRWLKPKYRMTLFNEGQKDRNERKFAAKISNTILDIYVIKFYLQFSVV